MSEEEKNKRKKMPEDEEVLEYDENMDYDENEYEIIEVDDDDDVEEEEEEDDEEEEPSIYPEELTDLRLECLYIGLLFNNPKAISRFYFEIGDCHFTDQDLLNLYKIIIFRE